MIMMRVKKGIYIDSGCNGIHQIMDGWFIPDAYSNDNKEEFHKDIENIHKKYFGNVVSGGFNGNDVCVFPTSSSSLDPDANKHSL